VIQKVVDKVAQMVIINIDYVARYILCAIWVGVFGWRQGRERLLQGNNIING